MPTRSKRKWKSAPPELVALFDRLVPGDDGVERRSMFGYPCAFVNGNMFAGLHEDRMVLRLDEADRERFRKLDGAGAFTALGRTMREYVVATGPLLGKPRSLAPWVRKSVAYTRSLPPKRPRRKKR